MIGPTGVGKTEIARRLAKLVGAPFVKVEATKYTEVGYYGRDVESMVRDLVENAVGLVRVKERERVAEARPSDRAEERLLDLLIPAAPGRGPTASPAPPTRRPSAAERTREKMKARLEAGELEDRQVEITVAQTAVTPVSILGRGQHGADGDGPPGHVREDHAQARPDPDR